MKTLTPYFENPKIKSFDSVNLGKMALQHVSKLNKICFKDKRLKFNF